MVELLQKLVATVWISTTKNPNLKYCNILKNMQQHSLGNSIPMVKLGDHPSWEYLYYQISIKIEILTCTCCDFV